MRHHDGLPRDYAASGVIKSANMAKRKHLEKRESRSNAQIGIDTKRTVEFIETQKDGFVTVAHVYLDGTTISGDCIPGKETLICEILNDYCLIDDRPVWAHVEPVRWFENLPRKFSNSYKLNAFFVNQ